MTTATPAAAGVPGYSEVMPCEPRSVARARLLIGVALAAWHLTELTQAGTMVVSELMTNAINHSRSHTARVTIHRLTADGVRIGVTDTSPDAPVMRRSAEGAEAGRGLLLVDALSNRWGYEVRERGTRSRKLVWAEVVL